MNNYKNIKFVKVAITNRMYERFTLIKENDQWKHEARYIGISKMHEI